MKPVRLSACPLVRSYYLNPDVVFLARDLLGKKLCTRINGIQTYGIITETEAYAGITDKASHAFGDRRTARTEIMYAQGGTAYVYLCYGMHSLFNVVTNVKGVPHAILVRAIEPVEGIETMLLRRGKSRTGTGFTDGPGKVASALGIHYSHSGMDLTVIPPGKEKSAIWIEHTGMQMDEQEILAGPRIGVQYAGEDAAKPYRFLIRKVGA
ncbi:MAG: DNA-3-methyladenine glycosylase [Bacteroidales bacterium]|nr:DNA-3-methyladenine glycosylase [Bacteroidales bacterium]